MDATITAHATRPDTTSSYLVHRARRRSARRLANATASYDRPDPRRTRALVRALGSEDDQILEVVR